MQRRFLSALALSLLLATSPAAAYPLTLEGWGSWWDSLVEVVASWVSPELQAKSDAPPPATPPDDGGATTQSGGCIDPDGVPCKPKP